MAASESSSSEARGNGATSAADREVVISRLIKAPRELVWQAWADPERIVQWWGPRGFTTTTSEFNMRTGGTWRFVMHGPDGRDYENHIVFTEVDEPQRLRYEHAGEGETVDVQFSTTVTFTPRGEDTHVVMRMVFPTRDMRERVKRDYGAVEGGLETVTRLAEHVAASTGGDAQGLAISLPAEREVVLRREFHAPRERVFEAMSKSEHVRRWWGMGQLEVCEMDFRPGGTWRFVERGVDGQVHPFRGEYREIGSPERIVQTFVYDVEGWRDNVAVETLTLEERDGVTVMTGVMVNPSQAARDGHVNAGMEFGAAKSFDRLAALLRSMAPGNTSATGARR